MAAQKPTKNFKKQVYEQVWARRTGKEWPLVIIKKKGKSKQETNNDTDIIFTSLLSPAAIKHDLADALKREAIEDEQIDSNVEHYKFGYKYNYNTNTIYQY